MVGEHGPEATLNRDGSIGQVGSSGPEIRNLQKGTAIVPNIKDGYSMLQYITDKVKNPEKYASPGTNTPQNMNPAPKITAQNKDVSNTAMIAAVNDKLDKTLNYIKTLGLKNKGLV
jgi:hypothetical protein